VNATLRSELFKHRSTRTDLGLFGGMLVLVLLAVILHGLTLPADELGSVSRQLMVLGPGQIIGTLFAALLGAMSITGEVRHGTIRPTFLVTPWRGRVVAAKVAASALIGAGFGLAAAAVAAGTAASILPARGIEIELDAGDFALMMVAGGAAAAFWAVIGVGVGAVVRNQVTALVGVSAWLLFVESLLSDNDTIVDVGRYAPGAAAAALTGQDPDRLLAPTLGLGLLIAYAAAIAVAGSIAMIRRDVG
jgi:ABC-2 type transport system permease protein